ncbi:hypothetical protein [Dictyobacter arantiisoli]|nr:hypothetical protein [Dictyobacter arantiisoli]
MKSIKLMLLGLVLMLLAVGLAQNIAPAIFAVSGSNPPAILKLFPGFEVFLLVMGLAAAIVGFFQKEIKER